MEDKATMTLETAAERYDVKLSTLRMMAAKGLLKTAKVGKRHYVTPEAMDAVFKGEGAGKAKAKRAPK